MNRDSQDFDQLRQLLALKRHEQPPPGYFHGFSREVVVRIKAGDKGERRPMGWIERIWSILEARPIFAGALGASACAVMISGLLNAEESPGIAGGIQPLPAGGAGAFTGMGTMASADAVSVSDPGLAAPPETPLESLFEFRPARLGTMQPVGNWVPAQ